jgi:hypothetical protein
MKGFLVFLVVAALAAGGFLYWKEHGGFATGAPALADAGAPARQVREKRKRRRRGARRVARDDTFVAAAPEGAAEPSLQPPGEQEPRPIAGGSTATEVGPSDVLGGLSSPRYEAQAPQAQDEPEPVRLGAADLRMVSRGDDLSRPEVTRLDMSDDGARELSQDDIDKGFRAKEDAILACIAKARPDQETWVPGSVTVEFRIQRTGTVHGVRVEAPAILQKGGVYGCVKGVLGGLRFPASTGSQVVSYPFSLT